MCSSFRPRPPTTSPSPPPPPLHHHHHHHHHHQRPMPEDDKEDDPHAPQPTTEPPRPATEETTTAAVEPLGARSAVDGQTTGEGLGDLDCGTSCRVPDTVETFTFVPPMQEARAPLSQVKTYVVEEDVARALHARVHGLPMALTQHNVHMHNTFQQRRLDRERMRLWRAELERRAGLAAAGGVGGGGMAVPPGHLDADSSRMRRWLIDTECQHDLQPLINVKIAIPAM